MGFDEWLQGRQMQVELNQQLNQLEQTRLLEEQNRLLRQQKIEQPRSQNSETKCPYCASPINQGAALCPSCHLPFFGLDLQLLAYAVKENPTLILPPNMTLENLSSACDLVRSEVHATNSGDPAKAITAVNAITLYCLNVGLDIKNSWSPCESRLEFDSRAADVLSEKIEYLFSVCGPDYDLPNMEKSFTASQWVKLVISKLIEIHQPEAAVSEKLKKYGANPST